MPRRALIVAMAAAWVLVAIITFRGLGGPFGNGDEVVYAQSIREMKAGAGYSALHWQGLPVLERPTLPFLPPAAISSVLAHERGLRLFAGICSLVILLIVYRLARELRLARDASMVAVFMVAGAPSFHLFSRTLLSDPPFVVATTLLLWAAVRAQRHGNAIIVAGVALGLALACKSLAAAVPAVVLAPWLWRGARAHVSRRQLAWAIVALVVLAAPYYVVSLALYGGDFVDQHFGRTLIERAQGDVGLGMPGGIAAYAIYFWQAEGAGIAVLFPLGCVVAAALAWRNKDAAVGVVAFTPLASFAIYSIIATRLPHYLLPLYPAAGLAVAVAVDRMRAAARGSSIARVVPVALALTLLGQGISAPPEEHFMPSGEAARLGYVVKAVAGEYTGPLYTFEWYAPAAAYYGHRRWVMITTSERLFRQLDANHHIHAPGAIRKVPPWPTETFLVAGPREVVESIPGDVAELAASGDYVLVKVVPRDSAEPREGGVDPR